MQATLLKITQSFTANVIEQVATRLASQPNLFVKKQTKASLLKIINGGSAEGKTKVKEASSDHPSGFDKKSWEKFEAKRESLEDEIIQECNLYSLFSKL